MYVSEESDFV